MPRRPPAVGRVRNSAIKSIRAIREECDRLERSLKMEAEVSASAGSGICSPAVRLIGLPCKRRQSSLEIHGKEMSLPDQLFEAFLHLALAIKYRKTPFVTRKELGHEKAMLHMICYRLRKALIEAGASEIAGRLKTSDGLYLAIPPYEIQIDEENLRATGRQFILDKFLPEPLPGKER